MSVIFKVLPLSEVMAAENRQLCESAVIRSLRRFRDRYFPSSGKDAHSPVRDTAQEHQPGYLDSLPVRLADTFLLGGVH